MILLFIHLFYNAMNNSIFVTECTSLEMGWIDPSHLQINRFDSALCPEQFVSIFQIHFYYTVTSNAI